ncbi:hypothetical protein AN958_04493 [Leucoagaricus sp. SymC.cos]|nr:hypothetical protein AN958_04493 [Leucoagaricus sp. SymC.cos]
MFFYISFLRPPPSQAAPNGSILITPQIANDLRTEPYESSQDIFYSWASYPQTAPQVSSSPAFTLKTTKPVKLTTYRNSSAFKEIPVPVPPGVREGQQWQLILSSSAQTRPLKPNYTIDSLLPAVGDVPFPVISMPILFSSKGLKGNVKKQERIERIYRFSNGVPGEGEATEVVVSRELKITEQTSFDLDKKIWDSGIGLSSWLVEFQASDQKRLKEPLDRLWNVLFSTDPRRMVELGLSSKSLADTVLGAGTGIVSLMVAALRSKFGITERRDQIIATDLESAAPLLNHNISSNLSLYPQNPPEAGVLDWDDENLPDSVSSLQAIDLIFRTSNSRMSDVTYNTDSFPALLATISKLLRIGEKPPAILLGYEERDETERGLWHLMKGIGIRLEKIGVRHGFAEPAIEIWFGHFVSSPSVKMV